MVLSEDVVNEGDGNIEVCVDPGVGGDIDLELVTTLDTMNDKASES